MKQIFLIAFCFITMQSSAQQPLLKLDLVKVRAYIKQIKIETITDSWCAYPKLVISFEAVRKLLNDYKNIKECLKDFKITNRNEIIPTRKACNTFTQQCSNL